jgi:uncharacterized protein YjdB
MKYTSRPKFLGVSLLAAVSSMLVAPQALAAAPATHGAARTAASVQSPQDVQTALRNAIERQAALHPNLTDRHICYSAHVQSLGWQPPVCDGAVAGTTGRSLRLEALDIFVSGVGGFCASGHVEKQGWQPVSCEGDNVNIVVGTTGQSLRMEALEITAHVQTQDWQPTVCASGPRFATVGTTGRSLRMEAVRLTV